MLRYALFTRLHNKHTLFIIPTGVGGMTTSRKKVFVSFDYEGLAGVTSWNDVEKRSPE